MTTISNAVWELQMDVVIAAAELVSGINLARMAAVTEVARTTPPSLLTTGYRLAVHRAPLADQQALVQAALSFRAAYENLVGEPTTGGKP